MLQDTVASRSSKHPDSASVFPRARCGEACCEIHGVTNESFEREGLALDMVSSGGALALRYSALEGREEGWCGEVYMLLLAREAS